MYNLIHESSKIITRLGIWTELMWLTHSSYRFKILHCNYVERLPLRVENQSSFQTPFAQAAPANKAGSLHLRLPDTKAFRSTTVCCLLSVYKHVLGNSILMGKNIKFSRDGQYCMGNMETNGNINRAFFRWKIH